MIESSRPSYLDGLNPAAQVAFDGVVDLGHLDAGGGELVGGHGAVGARGLGGGAHELGLVAEELELLGGDAGLFDQLDDLAGSDFAGVGDVVDPERHALFPAGEGGGDELLELRDGVGGLEQGVVADELREVIARVVDLVEGDAQAPDVNVGTTGEDFFAEGLGAGVEAAVVGAEGEIWGVGLAEARAVGPGAGVDAAGGDVAPGNAGIGAGLGDSAWQHGVAKEALGLVEFAGIDVRLASVASGIDQEDGLLATEQPGEGGLIGVVEI